MCSVRETERVRLKSFVSCARHHSCWVVLAMCGEPFFFFENPHRRGQIDLKRSCFRLVCFSSAGFDKKSTPPHTFLLCPHTQNIFRHQQTKPTSFGKYSSVCTRIFVSLCCFFPTRCCSIRRVETLRPLRVHSPDKSIQNPKGGKK